MFLERENGVKIYYETHGRKGDTPIIMVHGLGADHNMFSKQIKKYSEKGYYVVVPDMRGHGQSSKVKSLKLTDWTEDIYALMEDLNFDKAILLGVSMGGVIVQKFVTQYPEKVEKFILSDTFGEIRSFAEKMAALSQAYGFKFFKILPKNLAASMVALAYKGYDTGVYEYFKEVTLKADFDQIVMARKVINKIDILEELNQVNVPALVLVGDKYKIMLEPAEKITENIPKAELKKISGALDPSNMTQSKVFDRYVLGFI